MNTLAQCQNALLEQRTNAINSADRARTKLHALIPGLNALDNEIQSIPLRLMEAARGSNYEAKANELKKLLDALRERRSKMLVAAGFEPNYDDPHFKCTECNDRGYVGYKMCGCLKRMIAEENYRRSGLGAVLSDCTFDSFQTYYYPCDPAGADKSPREIMENIKSRCMKFASEFGKDSGNVLFMGGTGLGKTHISAAIGKVVISKGRTVIYESARNILNEYRTNAFSDGDFDTVRFEICDLLIIDDLGSEPKGEYSASVFTDIVDKRLLCGKSTIISTNLTAAEMVKSYSQRFVSRVLSCYSLMTFVGKDIRMLKMTEDK